MASDIKLSTWYLQTKNTVLVLKIHPQIYILEVSLLCDASEMPINETVLVLTGGDNYRQAC